MNDVNNEIKEELESRRNDLKQLADQVRLKMHLAGMDAKSKWKELEPKVHEFEERAKQLGNQAADELKRVGGDLQAKLKKLRDEVSKK